MKIEEMLDIFDIDEIEKMSPEECKGLLKGFFIGAGFIKAIDEGISEAIENRYKRKFENYTPYIPYRSPDRQDFRKIRLTFDSREDAVEILDRLREELEVSKDYYVSVRTLYYLADLPTNNEMLNWCWYDLEDCEITREADHYILKMPPAEPRHEPKKDRASDIS
jgi:hypothetical protein